MISLKDQPRFQPGDLVRHRRYAYRGVVVEVDTACRAPEQWYQSNRTQPERAQAWYHVLVHGSDHAVTYAAETSLEADDSTEPVAHPWVTRYFDAFVDGRYLRNDLPWHGAWPGEG